MSKSGPFIIIDDNKKDQLLYQIVLQNLKVHNPVLFFDDGKEALEYLETTKDNPFLIICDINMPQMDGLDLRHRIAANPYLKKKATPFVFMSSAASGANVKEAYALAVQGFFKKADSAAGLERILALLIEYWSECIEPNTYN
ncbi:MAG: response regulator [Bacteroidetes bacterium]|jgi:CheY-like chemotaxis protein|nr:response regulator [Bacteroidota bacterium]MDF2451883.1 response regulator [Bacteroidota bacterium]